MSEQKKQPQKLQTTSQRNEMVNGGGGGIASELEEKLEKLSTQETEKLVQTFQEHFEKCTKACKKPNILVAGITGAGKSTLINSVFGAEVAKAGVGMPITQHFQKFEPKDKPIVVYDSKGLEWKEHRAFIKDTGAFFSTLQKKKKVEEHIHVVWYVVNTGRGRIENFEADLVRKVFAPTPVIFILNKADAADSKTIKACKKLIKEEKLDNNKGTHVTVSKRTNWTQSWCPDCLSDDVFYDEETKELECTECDYSLILKDTFGMKKLIKHTCDLLPELAKDAFMFSQSASVDEKNSRSKEIVIKTAKSVALDTSGTFIKSVAAMCAKLFVIWGWPLTASTFKEGLASLQKDYIEKLKFQQRFAAAAVDKLFGNRLSQAFAGFIGYTMSRGMKKLNQNLIESCSKGNIKDMKLEQFFDEADLDEDIVKLFFEHALKDGIEVAFDKLWDLSTEELLDLKKNMPVDESGLFSRIVLPEDTKEKLKSIEDSIDDDLEKQRKSNIKIQEIDADFEDKEEKKKDMNDDIALD